MSKINPVTLGKLKQYLFAFEQEYPNIDIDHVPVYLGDDEELNGIHEAYFIDEDKWDDEHDSLIRTPFKGNKPGLFVLLS